MQERESPEQLCCRASSCEEHSNFILSCNLIGQRENKSFYVTEIVFWLGLADAIFGGTSDRRKYVCVRRLSRAMTSPDHLARKILGLILQTYLLKKKKKLEIRTVVRVPALIRSRPIALSASLGLLLVSP